MKLERAFIYPVKSLRGCEVAALELDDLGPVGDRRWMLVDADGRFVTQRQFPKLAVLVPHVSAEHLQLRCGEVLSPLTPRFASSSPRGRGRQRRVTVWGDSFDAMDCGDEVAAWISDVVGAPLRLVQFAPGVRREVDPRYAADAQTAFADGYPLLVVNLASLDALNAALPTPISIENFRPNLVVRDARAWSEDAWTQLAVGAERFDAVKPCARCVVINVDQRTGEKSDAPLKALTRLHALPGRGAVFGMNLVHRSRGVVRVGDEVTVVSA